MMVPVRGFPPLPRIRRRREAKSMPPSLELSPVPRPGRACFFWAPVCACDNSRMCGIVGAIASRNVVPILTEGLKRLEYRGYDSAGIAVVDGAIRRVRRVGRVAEMESAARAENLEGIMGIAHTRWATHGGVTEPNAHPHVSRDEIAVVHNGIIENHEEQRARLKALGYAFESQTDTEVVAHLIHHYYTETRDLFVATRKTAADLRGAYAIGVVALSNPDSMTAARMGCPLV